MEQLIAILLVVGLILGIVALFLIIRIVGASERMVRQNEQIKAALFDIRAQLADGGSPGNFHVEGVEIETGKQWSSVIGAESATHAKEEAEERGIDPLSVERVNDSRA